MRNQFLLSTISCHNVHVTYTGVKAFDCHICKGEFNYAYTLKDHMVNNHRDGATRLPAFASTIDVRCTVRIIETRVSLRHTASYGHTLRCHIVSL